MTLTVSSPGAGGDLPLVGYDNLFRDSGATITESTETTGYESSLAFDWRTSSAWLATASGSSWFRAQFSSGRGADYFAAYAPDLATNGGTIKLQHSSDGSAWTDATTALSPTAAQPIVWQSFTRATDTYWRVLVDSTPASYIPVVAAGDALQLENGFLPGFTPPHLNRLVEIAQIRTNGGTRIGRTRRRQGCRCRIATRYNSEEHIRNDWLPFLKHAELLPFFLSWAPVLHPSELALLEIDGDDNPAAYDEIGFHRVSIDTQGVCNDL